MSLINHTTWVKEYKDGNFNVKIGYFPEETYVGECFDDTCFDIEDRDILPPYNCVNV